MPANCFNPGDIVQRTYEVYSPTAAQNLTTTFADVDGSDNSFTPLLSDSEICYTFSFCISAETDSWAPMANIQLLVDGTLEAKSETVIFLGHYVNAKGNGFFPTFRYSIDSWGTSAKTIKLQARDHSTLFATKLHETFYWNGSASNPKLRQAVLVIEEVAT